MGRVHEFSFVELDRNWDTVDVVDIADTNVSLHTLPRSALGEIGRLFDAWHHVDWSVVKDGDHVFFVVLSFELLDSVVSHESRSISGASSTSVVNWSASDVRGLAMLDGIHNFRIVCRHLRVRDGKHSLVLRLFVGESLADASKMLILPRFLVTC